MRTESGSPALHWEDFTPGRTFALARVTVTREEILEFARSWDPQEFHLSAAGAAEIGLDDVIASGLHTLCICSRAFVTELIAETANLPGPEIGPIRWPHPVHHGDTIAISYEVVSTRLSRSRPDRGIVSGVLSAANQDGQTVIELSMMSFVRLRD